MQTAEFISTRSKLDRHLRQAATDVTRARVALKDNQPHLAFSILDHLAESFSHVATSLPAYVRTELWKLLRNHGLRNGPDALALAEQMLANGIDGLPDDASDKLRAGAMGNLALLRSIQLGQAPSNTALRSIAASYSRESDPMPWATAQLNLADALLSQGLTAEATRYFAKVLHVFTLQEHPVEWARVQVKLASIIQSEGQLSDAAAIYRKAAKILLEADERTDWAAVQVVLGSVLMTLGRTISGDEGAWTLAQAGEAFRAALDFHREDNVPTRWAHIREQLARAELALADHNATPVAYPHLRAALQHLDVVLSVCEAGFSKDRESEILALRHQVDQRLSDFRSGFRLGDVPRHGLTPSTTTEVHLPQS